MFVLKQKRVSTSQPPVGRTTLATLSQQFASHVAAIPISTLLARLHIPPERCDNATVRPLEPPLVKRGQPGQFIPFEVTNRDPVIRDLPATPIDLLFRYMPQEMAESWAQWTNEAPRSREGPRQRHSRENQ
ncbi:Uncharacterized protein HZ326_28563 [Fusarium oxysporum f. sp. albedinis]|nr:Uncharacterized protein HZ326_28563 [Fusarium oxysporum f. sp. albedinis]